MSPSVAIVACAYNAEAAIAEALTTLADAARRQDAAFHVLLQDDGSEDRTGEIMKSWSESTTLPVTVRQNRKNRGLAPTLIASYRQLVAWHVAEAPTAPDWVLKLDLDHDFSQDEVLEAMMESVHAGRAEPVNVGVRTREITPADHPYEARRRRRVLTALARATAHEDLDPASMGIQLYRIDALRQLLEHPLIESYPYRWGLDVLIPLLALKEDRGLGVESLPKASYDRAGRPTRKVRRQYDIYHALIEDTFGLTTMRRAG